MIAFIDEHRRSALKQRSGSAPIQLGVEPICRLLQIAPSTYYDHKAKERDPDRRSARAKSDEVAKTLIKQSYDSSKGLYGVRKIWHDLSRQGHDLARCTIERLMAQMGIQGVRRLKKVRTTIPDPAVACPLDKVQRNFHAPAPNRLWISDFTYVQTRKGMVYVAFVIDVYALKIVGWRVSTCMDTGFVLDALEQAVHDRRAHARDGLIHHSDRGSQYVSIKYTTRLADVGIEPSVGSVGDSYDNARAETLIGLFKAEVIWRQASWKSADEVEWETLRWVHWYNTTRLLSTIGYRSPVEAERDYYAHLKQLELTE